MNNQSVNGQFEVVESEPDLLKRLCRPLVGNVPRVSAATAIKLNDLRNKLLGTNFSLQEVQQQWLDGEVELA